jgi:hypothetical protein
MRPLFALLVVASLAVAAPVPKAIKAKLKDYYPLADGAEWEYSLGQETVLIKATEVTAKDDVTTAKLVTTLGGKSVADETIRVDSAGVFRTHINKTQIDPPVPLMKFGLTADEGWEVKAKVNSAELTGKFTLKSAEKVKVQAGEYDAVQVVGDCTLSGTQTRTKWWIAEGVGIVRMEFEIGGTASSTFELKKYTPGRAK